jgi:hypothetical protein
MGIISHHTSTSILFFIRQQESFILPGLLADGALSLRGQRGEHDDDAVVARRALDKVPELVAVEPDDGALEGELAQLLHLLCEAAPAPALLLPAHPTPTTILSVSHNVQQTPLRYLLIYGISISALAFFQCVGSGFNRICGSLNAVFRIRIQSGQWIRIPIRNPYPDPGRQK